ncbi:MAG: hypothetical protein ABIG90_01670 [bacterium]
MLKLSIIQGLAEGAAESLTKFFLERFHADSKKSEKPESSSVSAIHDYLEKKQTKQEKVNQIVQQLLDSSKEESEKLRQRLEQVKARRVSKK